MICKSAITLMNAAKVAEFTVNGPLTMVVSTLASWTNASSSTNFATTTDNVLQSYSQTKLFSSCTYVVHLYTSINSGPLCSGVTRVGVTWGGNWRCHPIFSGKTDDLFSHRPLESDDLFLAVVSSPLPSSHVVYPVFFLNSATKKFNFIPLSPLDGVTQGGPLPRPSP